MDMLTEYRTSRDELQELLERWEALFETASEGSGASGTTISRSPHCQRTSSELERLRRMPSADGLSPHTVATKDVIPAARASAASASSKTCPRPGRGAHPPR